MNYILDFIKKYWKIILLITGGVIIVISSIVWYFYSENKSKEKQNEVTIAEPKSLNLEEKEEALEKIRVDVKGEVKFPGVYELDTNCIVMDAITLAGGLNENATTENINLSYKLEEGMVIVIYNKNDLLEENKQLSEVSYVDSFDIKKEVKEQKSLIVPKKQNTKSKQETTNETIQTEVVEENKEPIIVNINTATKEELTTLSGIGESKAQKIIDYRETNGLFENVEQIKEVSGIGETIFESIKDYIVVQ